MRLQDGYQNIVEHRTFEVISQTRELKIHKLELRDALRHNNEIQDLVIPGMLALIEQTVLHGENMQLENDGHLRNSRY